ncbi:MAG: pyridoxal phosphate-dependent aminotransferase [Acidobacteria bacterium]|nr:pyridoxal phosphate-dependent aminotransferase [Acidobacteriota bacterium]
MFSRRIPPELEPNALSRAVAAARARGTAIADLTDSNPTRAGIPYPDDLLAPLADSAALRYEPYAFGMPAARAAVAADHARRGVVVDPAHVVLTASTSEAYSWLFKLLCDAGDSVLVPRPSYPLFEHLTALEEVRAQPYDLVYDGRWTIDVASMLAAPAGTRAVLVVSPNNPTGSYLAAEELAALSQLCRDRRWALIVDEVFADYPLDARDPLTDIALRAGGLSFSLAGLSKSVGLPQLKLAWIVVGGPAAARDRALAALELIADSYLSVATPVQVAAAHLLHAGGTVRAAIQQRIRQNLDALRAAARGFPACEVLRAEGGWSAVIRVPATRREEQLVVELLEREAVLAHSGYFFDFPREAYLVVSLLPPPALFADACARLLRFVST